MITSLRIENFRGIRRGSLEDLAPLTILTGPNACGKSAILDALLIATSPKPDDGVGRAVSRHRSVTSGARWLCFGESASARVEVGSDSGERWSRGLRWIDDYDDDLGEKLRRVNGVPPFSTVAVDDGDELADESTVAFDAENRYERRRDEGEATNAVGFVRLVDPGLPIPLHQTFSAVQKAGRRNEVELLLKGLIPGFERLEILSMGGNHFGLHVVCDGRAVPVGLSGDGVQGMVQLALEIAVAPEGLVLIEEPEVYQHPKAIWLSAKALLANMRRGVQVVLTTHSLELIDALLSEAAETDLDSMALFNLKLEDGELSTGRSSGSDMTFARRTLETDLR
ncbi:MAG: AAA family ATPase [Acidobacteriota bacterium]